MQKGEKLYYNSYSILFQLRILIATVHKVIIIIIIIAIAYYSS